ncbi:Thiol-disulfide isomerase or thioredoxin [bacterium A37T11]|nr:Thiol-disulfide isomerase or thioredoxin [bacterium A37T11]
MKYSYLLVIICYFNFFLPPDALAINSNRTDTNRVNFTITLVNNFGGDKANVDTLWVLCYDHALSNTTDIKLKHSEIFSARAKDGNFYFTIPDVSKPQYFSLGTKVVRGFTTNNIGQKTFFNRYDMFNDFLRMYLMEPGDQINMSITAYHHPLTAFYETTYTPTFEGLGSAKYTCRFQLDYLMGWLNLLDNSDSASLSFTGKYQENNAFDKAISGGLHLIESFRSLLTNVAYDILKADLVSESELSKYNEFNIRKIVYPNEADKTTQGKRNIKIFKEQMLSRKLPYISEEAQLISKSYPLFYLKRFSYLSDLSPSADDLALFTNLKSIKNIPFRDKILTKFLYDYNKSIPHINSIYEETTTIVNDSYYKNVMKGLMGLLVGSPAYQFKLQDKNGTIVSLADFKDKIVFLDFWFNGCSACAKYYKYVLKDVERDFKSNPNIIFITVNYDSNLTKWKDGLESGIYTSNEAINLNTNGQGLKHPLITFYGISSAPFPMIIDQKGNISSYGTILRDKNSLVNNLKELLRKTK